MNIFAVIFLVIFGLGLLRGLGQMITGRPALKEPESGAELVARVLVYLAVGAGYVWLFVMAVTA